MSSDQVITRKKNIHLSSVGGASFWVEKGNVDGKKETIMIASRLGTEGRRHKFFNRQRMNIKMLLKIIDVLLVWTVKVDPRDALKRNFSERHNSIVLYLCDFVFIVYSIAYVLARSKSVGYRKTSDKKL